VTNAKEHKFKQRHTRQIAAKWSSLSRRL